MRSQLVEPRIHPKEQELNIFLFEGTFESIEGLVRLVERGINDAEPKPHTVAIPLHVKARQIATASSRAAPRPR